MRAIKAIALITALLSLACMVGFGLVILQLFQNVSAALTQAANLPTISYEAGMSIEDILQQSGQAGLQDAVLGLIESTQESQMLVVVLFCAAVAFLLITMVLLVALRPERSDRARAYGYDG